MDMNNPEVRRFAEVIAARVAELVQGGTPLAEAAPLAMKQHLAFQREMLAQETERSRLALNAARETFTRGMGR